jgi:hypothetical protein
MRTAIALRYVIGVAKDGLLEGFIPLQGNLHLDALTPGNEVANRGMDWNLVAIQVVNEGSNPPLVFKDVFAPTVLIT